MSKFNLYLEKVIKEKEIINEKYLTETNKTALSKILDIIFNHKMIQMIDKYNLLKIEKEEDRNNKIDEIKEINEKDKRRIKFIMNSESLEKILETNNVKEIKKQYKALKEFFLDHGIDFEKEDFEKKDIERVINKGDTNHYKNYNLGTSMSTAKYKKIENIINSEFRKVSV